MYYALTEGFSLARIQETIEFPEDLSLSPPSQKKLETLNSICSQQFSYLKKGSQAYAFISDDEKYILKLFKYHHMKPTEWLLNYSLPEKLGNYRDALVARRRHRINLTLRSYTIAATDLQEECALLYIQVLPTPSYQLSTTIKDAIGRTYTIDLAKQGFAIQKKASLIRPSFEKWLAHNEMDRAKKAIHSIISTLVLRSKKGIQDSDPDLHKNAGLIETQAVFIDIGAFHRNPKISENEEMQRDIKKVCSKFRFWLYEHSSELGNYLDTLLEQPWEI